MKFIPPSTDILVDKSFTEEGSPKPESMLKLPRKYNGVCSRLVGSSLKSLVVGLFPNICGIAVLFNSS